MESRWARSNSKEIRLESGLGVQKRDKLRGRADDQPTEGGIEEEKEEEGD